MLLALANPEGGWKIQALLFRVQFVGSPKTNQRFQVFARFSQNDSEVAVGIGICRFHFDGLLVVIDSRVEKSFRLVNDAEPVAANGILRIQSEGRLEGYDGLFRKAFRIVGDAEVVVGRTTIWIQFDGLFVRGDCPIRVSRFIQTIAKRVMKQAASRSMKIGAKGIKISCSGRISGAEIARTEWHLEGRLPLHTLRADIDYGFAESNTTYGKIGVKVWIFKGEILPTKDKLNEKIHIEQKTETLTSDNFEKSASEGVQKDVTTN